MAKMDTEQRVTMTSQNIFTDPEQTFSLQLPAGVTLMLETTLLPDIRYYEWSGEKSAFSIYCQRPPGQIPQEYISFMQEDSEVRVEVNRPFAENGQPFHLLRLQTSRFVQRSRHQKAGQIYDVPAHTTTKTVQFQFWPGQEWHIRVGYAYESDVSAAELERVELMLTSFQLVG